MKIREDRDWDCCDWVERVCKRAPIWQVTVVQGKLPTKAPRKQSMRGIRHTPEAMFRSDHGTIPINRRSARRIQVGDLTDDATSCGGGEEEGNLAEVGVDGAETGNILESPSKAARVSWKALGKQRIKKGASGMDSNVAHTEPIVVNRVSRMAAGSGENRAPPTTFHITLPGIDQACFHIADMLRTKRT